MMKMITKDQLFLVKTGWLFSFIVYGAVYRLYDNKTDHESKFVLADTKNSRWYEEVQIALAHRIVDDDGNCTCGNFVGIYRTSRVW